MILQSLALFLAPVFFVQPASARIVTPPFDMMSAKVLPKGVRNARFIGIRVEGDEKFNSGGQEVGLGDPFFKSFSWSDVIFGKKTPDEQAGLEAILSDLNIDPNSEIGSTTGDVRVRSNVMVPVIAYGLTSKITLGLAVPIISYNIKSDVGVVQTSPETINQVKNKLIEKGRPDKAEEAVRKLRDPINSKLSDYGYNPLATDKSDTKIGDIRLVSKFSVYDSVSQKFALQAEVTFPTGSEGGVNDLVDVSAGEDQYDVGVGVLYEAWPSKYFGISTQLAHTIQLPDRKARRIWERSDSAVTPDIDPNTQRNLGDISTGRAMAQFKLKGFKGGLGYSLLYKAKDRYEGDEFESIRYQWMGKDTRQRMQTMQLSLGYDTLDLFKRKKFAVPLSLVLNHSVVLEGKNIVRNPITSLDFNLYF